MYECHSFDVSFFLAQDSHWIAGFLAGTTSKINILEVSTVKLARDCRTIIMSAWYKHLFPTRLADRLAVHDFATAALGTRMATSVGGVLTGRGADLIVIEDALKPDEALSETRRKAVNDWYDNTLLSRLNDKASGCIIIIMQRLHQEDLVGHVLEREPWEVLSSPAIAEENERFLIESPIGSRWSERKVGEALHPERESLATLARIRERMGEYNFSSQYQQNPIPLGGAMVKTQWLKYYAPNELPERFDTIVQSWDTANKPTELSDYSVCTTWGQASNTKGIRTVDHDLAVPLLELLRNILVSRKWDSKEDNLTLISVLDGLGKDAGTEFFRQRRASQVRGSLRYRLRSCLPAPARQGIGSGASLQAE